MADRTDFLGRLLDGLKARGIRYCVLGGQGVNAYADPVVSLDLDLVIALDQLHEVKSWLRQDFVVESFEHSLNVSAPGSDLRVQVQTDSRYASFVDRATEKSVLGYHLPVARLEDVLQGKIWAVQDPTRRPSKRQKDLADIARLLEVYPHLRDRISSDILARLI
jgi:hypothetical protein